eukprot:scaffold234299_cov36-Prasinocladus_malaysianus.AAC.3
MGYNTCIFHICTHIQTKWERSLRHALACSYKGLQAHHVNHEVVDNGLQSRVSAGAVHDVHEAQHATGHLLRIRDPVLWGVKPPDDAAKPLDA